MAKEICISSTPHETRLAILEDDQLAEIYYERENEYTLAGSVYKGRVTRVLPGMQSAFVDIGLERDAFLYVTDFLEMEDQEDADEVERAVSQGDTVRLLPSAPSQGQLQPPAAQAATTPPVNGGRGGRDGRGGRRDGRGDRTPRVDADLPAPAAPQFNAGLNPGLSVSPALSFSNPTIPVSVADATAQQDEADEQGARRFRGRRRRRGGRGRDEVGAVGAPSESKNDLTSEPFAEEEFEEAEVEALPAIAFEAAAFDPPARPAFSSPAPVREPREDRSATPKPFLMPGESLSKYGASAPATATPSRLVVTSLPPDTSDPLPERTATRPSTLVEDEIVWDGRGLFPGESIARHRQADSTSKRAESAEPEFEKLEPVQVDAEPVGVFAALSTPHESSTGQAEISAPAGAFEFTEELVPSVPEEFGEQFEEEFAEDDLEDGYSANIEAEEAEFEEVESSSASVLEDQPTAHQSLHGLPEDAAQEHDREHDEPGDLSASHNVDPLPPSPFRLSDLFGSRKKEEEAERVPTSTTEDAPPAPRTVSNVSAYSPGAGLVEEEVIDEEEYESAPLKAHHGEDGDLEELEEETLQQQIHSGALGEMLQEAHLDHRIQMETVSDDEEDEDEESPAVGATPGVVPGNRGGRDRSGDRGGRGRRGRSGSGGGLVTTVSAPAEGRGEARSDGRGEPRNDARRGGPRRAMQASDLPIISDLLKPGQEILVQIAKEPIAKKGARITSHIALPGRFLVFMPTVSHVGVSRKIASDEERQRLKRILVSEKGEASGGFIVRTAADGATEEELRADLRFLINLWNDIKQRADSSKPPALIYHDLNLIERILRDQVSDNFSHIWVDSEADYERIVRFLNRFSPELVRRVKLYTKEEPLFEHFGIQDEISKALRSKVWLKSGGSIVINQTEALVAIDINTGKFVGKTARLEDTILKTNLDAIPEIVRQIRLRDLGGIIVIDFIDMDERKNRTRVMAALEEALKQDRAPTKVLQFNDFGLVAITRKRVKQSLERTLSVPCPVCQATGMVKSAATVANEIYIEIRKMRKHFDGAEVLLRVNPETAKALKSNNARWLTELEDLAGKNVLIKSDATLHPEQFDIQG